MPQNECLHTQSKIYVHNQTYLHPFTESACATDLRQDGRIPTSVEVATSVSAFESRLHPNTWPDVLPEMRYRSLL